MSTPTGPGAGSVVDTWLPEAETVDDPETAAGRRSAADEVAARLEVASEFDAAEQAIEIPYDDEDDRG